MAKPTRRSVLRAGVVALVAAAPLGAAEHAMSVVAGGVASGLRRGTFRPNVGTSFALVGADGTHRAVLENVDDLGNGVKGDELRFRLLFHVKGSAPDQGTYRLRHPRVAALDLFVSPVGQRPGVYEAVIDARR